MKKLLLFLLLLTCAITVNAKRTVTKNNNDFLSITNFTNKGINNIPIASDDVYTVTNDSSIALDFLANDFNEDGGVLTITSINGTILTGDFQDVIVDNGQIDIDGSAGLFFFTPDYNFIGEVTFPYTISDSNGDTDTGYVFIEVTGGSDITSIINITEEITCNNPNGATITIESSGGMPPYSYNLIDNDDNLLTQTSNVFSSLTIGDYTITTTDVNGDSIDSFITIESPEVVTFTTTLTDCQNGVRNGIIVDVISGTAPFEFSIDNGVTWNISSTNSYVFTELVSGFYSPVVRDSNGCLSQQEEIKVNEPLIGIINVVDNFACTEGQIVIESQGGDGNYEYAIASNNETPVYSSNQFYTITSAGDYNVYVRDSSGCVVFNSVSLVYEELVVFADQVGENEIVVVGSGGVLPYTYSIDGGVTYQDSNEFSNLTPGVDYAITVRDVNGCTTTGNYSNPGANNAPVASDDVYEIEFNTVINLTPLDNDFDADFDPLTISAINDVLLTGMNQDVVLENGQIDVDASGVLFFTPNIDFAGEVNFSYEVSDSNGGTDIGFVTINIKEAEELAVSVSVLEESLCSGANDAAVLIEILSGTAPFIYEIATDNNVLNSVSALEISYVFSSLEAGSYQVTTTDANNNRITQDILINEQPPILITTEVINPTCSENNDGSIIINATGGNGPYLYSLADATGVIANFVESNTFENLAAGTYEVIVFDNNGCGTSTPVIITDPLPVVLSGITILPSGSEISGNISLQITGGSGSYIFSLNGLDFGTNNNFSELPAGDYVINYSDVNGCASQEITVTVTSLNIDNSVVSDTSSGLSASFKEAISYQWVNADTKVEIDGATSPNFIPSEYGNYYVEMTLSNTIDVGAKGVDITQQVNDTIVVLSPTIAYTAGVLGVDDVDNNSFNVYPNPTSDFITVPSVLIGGNYIVYNIIGERMVSGKINDSSISLSNLSVGMYFLRVEGYAPVKIIKK